MYSKSLLIAVAALALSATSTQAYGGMALARAKLTEEQQAAFAIARELQKEGDIEKAKEVLVDAGINEDTLDEIRAASKAARAELRIAVEAALKSDDFEAFAVAVADTPLADIVTTEEDFERFKEAYDLKEEGDLKGAHEILTDLGVKTPLFHARHDWRDRPRFTPEQLEALRVARAANDEETVQAIFEEAGFDGSRVEKRLKDGRFFAD